MLSAWCFVPDQASDAEMVMPPPPPPSREVSGGVAGILGSDNRGNSDLPPALFAHLFLVMCGVLVKRSVTMLVNWMTMVRSRFTIVKPMTMLWEKMLRFVEDR